MRITKPLTALLCCGLPLGLFAQRDNARMGEHYFEQGQYDKALSFFERAYAKHPKHPHVNLRLAQLYVENGEADQARKYIDYAYEKRKKLRKKEQPELLFTLAEVDHWEHDFKAAIQFYKESGYDSALVAKRIQECEYGLTYLASPQVVEISNLGTALNSEEHDFSPHVTADGKKMFFTSHRITREGENAGKVEDVYFSKFDNGSWTPPANLGAPINTDHNDAIVGLSSDGQTMFIYRDDVGGGDLFMSELHDSVWTEPHPLPFNTELKESSVSISPDERTLFFVRREENGVQNLYTSKKEASGNWSEAVKMGDHINSDYDEDTPFMHPDGKTLYFSSKGHSTMGNSDVFKVVWDEETGEWSEPENLGYPINTAGREVGFVMSAEGVGYYASSKSGGSGGADIYEIKIPQEEKKHNLMVLKGFIKEELSNKPIEARITLTNNTTGEVIASLHSNGSTGEYLVTLPAGVDYGIAVEHEGHLFHSEHFSLEKLEGVDFVEKNVWMPVTKKGSKIVLRNIFFETGKSNLTQNSFPELNKLVEYLNKYPEIKVEISGHTDNVGSDESNLKLSVERAKAVVNYLVAQGIKEERLVPKGYGSFQPIASNDDDEGRSLNRRTEFKVLDEQ